MYTEDIHKVIIHVEVHVMSDKMVIPGFNFSVYVQKSYKIVFLYGINLENNVLHKMHELPENFGRQCPVAARTAIK